MTVNNDGPGTNAPYIALNTDSALESQSHDPAPIPQPAEQSRISAASTAAGSTPPCAEKKSWFLRAAAKVWSVVRWPLMILAGVALFICNPMFFAVGFVVGLIFNNKVKECIDKIVLVFKKQPWTLFIIVAIGAFLALPITLATASISYAAFVGSKITDSSEKKAKEDAEKKAYEEALRTYAIKV